jgi:hypothetical protein
MPKSQNSPAVSRWTEKSIVEAVIQARYSEPWLCFPQFRPGTGASSWADKAWDLFAFNPWPSGGYERHVVEVKVSRGDFLREIKDPLKRRAGLFYSTQFWFAAPVGVVQSVEEIPIHCGLYELDRDEFGLPVVSVGLQAPALPAMPPTWSFLAAAARRTLNGRALEDARSQLKQEQLLEKERARAVEKLKAENSRLRRQVRELQAHNASLMGGPKVPAEELEPLLMMLCEQMGVRFRKRAVNQSRATLQTLLALLKSPN